VPIKVAGVAAQLAEYDGSMFELRALAEPLVAGDVPGKLVVYLPGLDVEPRASVLLELELAGERITEHYKLKQLARNVLRDRYTDGVIDELTDRPGVGYAELAEAAMEREGAEPPSILKGLFPAARGGDDLVAAWLASSAKDEAIVAKHGTSELVKLVRSRLGLELPADVSVPKLRALTLRYVLGSEFRSDLAGAAPASLDAVPVPKNGNLERVRSCAHRLRTDFPDAYADLADRVEDELGRSRAPLDPAGLGGIDTFRFEERVLLTWCGELIVGERYDEAQALVAQREHSYWLARDVGRKAQWEACRRMAELGRVATSVRADVTTSVRADVTTSVRADVTTTWGRPTARACATRSPSPPRWPGSVRAARHRRGHARPPRDHARRAAAPAVRRHQAVGVARYRAPDAHPPRLRRDGRRRRRPLPGAHATGRRAVELETLPSPAPAMITCASPHRAPPARSDRS
jgi:hypothetical protein